MKVKDINNFAKLLFFATLLNENLRNLSKRIGITERILSWSFVPIVVPKNLCLTPQVALFLNLLY